MTRALLPLFLILAAFLVNYQLQRRRSAVFDFRCECCGTTFPLSALAGAVAPHRPGGRKWIRCPQCGRFSWASPVPRE